MGLSPSEITRKFIEMVQPVTERIKQSTQEGEEYSDQEIVRMANELAKLVWPLIQFLRCSFIVGEKQIIGRIMATAVTDKELVLTFEKNGAMVRRKKGVLLEEGPAGNDFSETQASAELFSFQEVGREILKLIEMANNGLDQLDKIRESVIKDITDMGGLLAALK